MAGKKLTKSQFVAAVAAKCEMTKTQTSAVIEAINAVVVEQLGKKGPGEIVLPGLLKLTVVNKPAIPERQGTNPFTKEPTVFKAKPASKAVRARAVKALKDAI